MESLESEGDDGAQKKSSTQCSKQHGTADSNAAQHSLWSLAVHRASRSSKDEPRLAGIQQNDAMDVEDRGHRAGILIRRTKEEPATLTLTVQRIPELVKHSVRNPVSGPKIMQKQLQSRGLLPSINASGISKKVVGLCLVVCPSKYCSNSATKHPAS